MAGTRPARPENPAAPGTRTADPARHKGRHHEAVMSLTRWMGRVARIHTARDSAPGPEAVQPGGHAAGFGGVDVAIDRGHLRAPAGESADWTGGAAQPPRLAGPRAGGPGSRTAPMCTAPETLASATPTMTLLYGHTVVPRKPQSLGVIPPMSVTGIPGDHPLIQAGFWRQGGLSAHRLWQGASHRVIAGAPGPAVPLMSRARRPLPAGSAERR
ncbi:MAG: hypothetical protein RLY78_3916 [Pseudomonadota bacterium]